MLEVEDLCFSYRTRRDVLRGVSFTLDAGDILCLLGSNGTGKTTLLRCLLGFQNPSREVWQLMATIFLVCRLRVVLVIWPTCPNLLRLRFRMKPKKWCLWAVYRICRMLLRIRRPIKPWPARPWSGCASAIWRIAVTRNFLAASNKWCLWLARLPKNPTFS